MRKLHASDRLVGAARLVEAAGLRPRHLALGIAAALFFDPADDPAAQQLQHTVRERGPAAALDEVAGIAPDEPLARQILSDYDVLKPAPAASLRRLLATPAP
ncbi:MAG: Mannitol-1-phosphate 5-dehydrogenase [Lentisphaerae bacterium ADurb.BinA184]|nr:MAG: Mannitol-1-phosphate 5-dehydrogenase [Lentisphaerae bacterium ADurb.BinA184]